MTQLENCISKSIREKQGKSDSSKKVIRRELASILTLGTLVDPQMLTDDANNFCMSIRQEKDMFGVAVVDASIGEFRLCSFSNDAITKLETLLYQLRPSELVYERNNLQPNILKLVKNASTNLLQMSALSSSEWWDADKTVLELSKANYFEGSEKPIALEKFTDSCIVMSALGSIPLYY